MRHTSLMSFFPNMPEEDEKYKSNQPEWCYIGNKNQNLNKRKVSNHVIFGKIYNDTVRKGKKEAAYLRNRKSFLPE